MATIENPDTNGSQSPISPSAETGIQEGACGSKPEKRPLRLGLLNGKGWIAEDFDDPLPDEILAGFEER